MTYEELESDPSKSNILGELQLCLLRILVFLIQIFLSSYQILERSMTLSLRYSYYSPYQDKLSLTVTPKSVTITNLKLGREAPRNHPWESRFALVGPNIVQALGYKPIPGSRDSAQGPPRYNSFKTGTPL